MYVQAIRVVQSQGQNPGNDQVIGRQAFKEKTRGLTWANRLTGARQIRLTLIQRTVQIVTRVVRVDFRTLE